MSRLRAVLAILALTAGASAPAFAQSTPPVSRTKLVATHAVNKTNAQTAAMTAESDTGAASASGSTPAAPGQRRPGDKGAEGARATETAAGATVEKVAERPMSGFDREVFVYDRSGRRDPFTSLMSSSELRPLLSDLRLVAVAFDETGRNSVAVLRDVNTKDQYRVRVGQSLGRMRAARIDPKSITFTIEEFGFSRQETLGLGDSNKGSSK
jgi:hypothetical protein